MSHLDYCGEKKCSDCEGCKLENNMPCYPDCEGFNKGYMKTNSCIECDALISYVEMFITSNNHAPEDIIKEVKDILIKNHKNSGTFNLDNVEEAVGKILGNKED